MPHCNNCNGYTFIPGPGTGGSSGDCPDCLVARSAIIPCTEGVVPCGGTFSIDLAELVVAAPCGVGGYTIEVDDVDTQFLTDVVLTGNVLSGEIVGVPGQSHLPWVRYRVRCNTGVHSARGYVRVCVSNPCANKICPSDQFCDPCTGDCLQGTNDISLTGTPSGGVGTIGGIQIG